jgi:hypothetical protein
MRRPGEVLAAELRKNFKLHLLRANVVGDVFTRHRQFVASRNRLLWN